MVIWVMITIQYLVLTDLVTATIGLTVVGAKNQNEVNFMEEKVKMI